MSCESPGFAGVAPSEHIQSEIRFMHLHGSKLKSDFLAATALYETGSERPLRFAPLVFSKKRNIKNADLSERPLPSLWGGADELGGSSRAGRVFEIAVAAFTGRSKPDPAYPA